MKKIFVDLSRQKLYAFDGNVLFQQYNCVSGDNENPTTPGSHKVYRKHKKYRSKKYNAQMDYAMFFHGGEAIHESHVVVVMSYGRVALRAIGLGDQDPFGSHGCVRLQSSAAEELFNWTPMGTPVYVVESNPSLPGPT
ncbi:MAG: L,D-transpeptidase [Planctomycetaceae bacterium]